MPRKKSRNAWTTSNKDGQIESSLGGGGIRSLGSDLRPLGHAVLRWDLLSYCGSLCNCLVCSVFAPGLLYVFGSPKEYFVMVGILCLFIVFRHRSNVTRLIQGKENKI